jgi:hypothetical protein
MEPFRSTRFVLVQILVPAALAAASFVACSSQSDSAVDRDGGSRETGSGSGVLLSDGGTGSGAGSCAFAGDTQVCWTGQASQRGVGACHDGTQQCTQQVNGEFVTLVWGPCTGEELDCGDATARDGGGSIDASEMCTSLEGGTGSAGGSTLAPPCVPGSSRWCDDGSCYWGTQQCQSDGTWGDCNDTPGNAGPPGCPPGDINYDENCCAQNGQCCAHAVDGNNYGSVGSCGQVDPCACQQLCAQGATRWCDYGYAIDSNGDGSGGTWGQQQCGADGTWGACASASSVPSGCSSGSEFDQDCCISSGECCQAFDDEGSDPISVNCPATACSAQWSAAGDDDGGDYVSGGGPADIGAFARSVRRAAHHLSRR